VFAHRGRCFAIGLAAKNRSAEHDFNHVIGPIVTQLNVASVNLSVVNSHVFDAMLDSVWIGNLKRPVCGAASEANLVTLPL
jgi:hypothetical protein